MNKPGLSLLEVVVFIAIASIIITGLTQFITQTNVYQKSVFNQSSVYTRASILLHQFRKDITSIYIPIQNLTHEKKKNNDLETKQKNLPSTDKESAVKEKKTEPVKPITHVLYSEEKSGQTMSISFVTHNALKTYWSATIGSAKPSVARVTYTLQSDPEHKDSFILYRSESYDLVYDMHTIQENKKVKPYEIITGIKTFLVKFIVIAEEESAKKDSKQQQSHKNEKKAPVMTSDKKALPKITEYPSWNWPLDEKKKDDNTTTQELFPTSIQITVDLWDEYYERTVNFTYTIPLICTVESNKTEVLDKDSTEKNNQKNDVIPEKAASGKGESSPDEFFTPNKSKASNNTKKRNTLLTQKSTKGSLFEDSIQQNIIQKK